MSGDIQVRFCERPRVRLARATHPVFVFKKEIEVPQFQQALAARMQEGRIQTKSGMIPFSAEAPKAGVFWRSTERKH